MKTAMIQLEIQVSDDGQKCDINCIGYDDTTFIELEMCRFHCDYQGQYIPIIDGNCCTTCLDAEVRDEPEKH